MRPSHAAPLAEVEAFLSKNADVAYVDALLFDLCAKPRGKRYPRAGLLNLFTSGIQLPVSTLFLDVTGDSLNPLGLGFDDGDPDGTCWPLAGSLRRVQFTDDGPAGQLMLSMCDADGEPSAVEPRNVLRRVIERFDELGLTPVVACELEFYLLQNAQPASAEPVVLTSGDGQAGGTQVYDLAALDAHAGFFELIRTQAAALEVPASVASAEFAPAQFEVNLQHVADPLKAADHSVLLRHIVTSAARAGGFAASFAAKPFAARSGSGLHTHLSVIDADGRNAFDDGTAAGGDRLRCAIAGVLASLQDAMAIFAPNINSYRRFKPNMYVPVNTTWGFNNRSVAVRVPMGPGSSRRLEHRVAGADANPYLVLAAILAGVHDGLSKNCTPPPAATGNACAESDAAWPVTLTQALARLASSNVMRRYLGDDYVELYCATKAKELEKFADHISPLEYEWYL